MVMLNRGDTRTPSHLKERAERLRDAALSASDEAKAARLRRQAQALEDEARKSSRIRGR